MFLFDSDVKLKLKKYQLLSKKVCSHHIVNPGK